MRFTTPKSLLTTSCSVALASALAVVSAHPACANINYSYVPGQKTYTAGPGGTVNVPIYLDESLTGNSPSLLAADGGLASAGFQVSRATTGPGNPAALGSVTAAPGFGGPSAYFTETASEVAFTESVSLQSTTGVAPTSVSAGLNQIYLGTLTIQAGSLAGETTDFTLGPIVAHHGNTLTNDNFYDLDQTDNGGTPGSASGQVPAYNGATSTAFTVTTSTPEPSSLPLLALGGLAGLILLKRRHISA
jgi:hypothetical protein